MQDTVTTFGEKVTKEFWGIGKEGKTTNSPVTPRLIQTAARNEEEKLGKEAHREFGSGVGSLLCLLKHSRPGSLNPIGELNRCMAGQISENVEEMCCVIKGVIDIPNVGLRTNPKVTFNDKGK